MHITTTSLACLAMLPGTMVLAASDPIPFPDALDDAAIVQATIDDVDSKAMIVGNGDIKSLWKNFPRSFYPLPKSSKTNPPPR